MPLEKMLMRNFQCHERLDITFDKRVTTIVGPSDVGKSAVIRAIRWLVTNKPSGDAFRKEGTKTTTVGLKFDGQTLVRRKGDSTNKITLDGKEYKAFGTDVPEPVVDALNLSEVSFQSQHDSPFWFSSTAGQISRELNAIVNLDVIDSTLKNLVSELRKAKIEKEGSQARLKEAEEEKTGLAYVTKLSADFDRLQRLEDRQAKKASELAHLEALWEEGSSYQKMAGGARKAHSDGLAVVEVGKRARKKGKRLESLLKLISEAVGAEREASVELPTSEEMSEVADAYGEWSESKKKLSHLGVFTLDVKCAKDNWLEADQAVIVARQELGDKSEGICPLCGGEMKGS